MKFAVVSDLHYYAEEMVREKSHFEDINDKFYEVYKLRRALSIKELEMVTASDVDTVFVIGDLTDFGDRVSNAEMEQMLRKMKNSGKRVYVLTATHDFNHNRPYSLKHPQKQIYSEKFWESPYFKPEKYDYRAAMRKHHNHLSDKSIIPEFGESSYFSELGDLYHDYGPAEAVSTCGYSYSVNLDDNTVCLMLNDCFRNTEGITKDNSPTFTPECFDWIASQIEEAKRQGKFIFACTHHPMLPPSPAYKVGAGTRDMRKAYIGHFLADMGLTLIFTGHTHACDVGFLQSDAGNILCDITTPSANTFPPQFRIVDLDGASGKIKIKAIDVDVPEGFDLHGKSLKEYMRQFTYDKIAYDLADTLPIAGKAVQAIKDKWKIKHVYPLCKGASGLTREEYQKIKDGSMYDLVTRCAGNMMCGDGEYTPDTPEYKLMMGFAATLDGIVDALPIYDIRKNLLSGYTARQIVEPLLFNNYIPDGEAEFDFTVMPKARLATKEFKSRSGIVFIVALSLLSIPISAIAVPTLPILIPTLSYVKSKNNIKKPTLPERY